MSNSSKQLRRKIIRAEGSQCVDNFFETFQHYGVALGPLAFILLALVDVGRSMLEQLLERKLKVRAHDPPPVAAWLLSIHLNFGFSVQSARILRGAECVRKLYNPQQRIQDADVAGMSIKHDTAPEPQRLQQRSGGRQVVHFNSNLKSRVVNERRQLVMFITADREFSS